MTEPLAADENATLYFLRQMWNALDGFGSLPSIEIAGCGSLPSVFATTDLAAAAVGVAALAVARFVADCGAPMPPVTVDRRLASFWFDKTFEEEGWEAPPVWDPIAGDYPTLDGWIRLHTNAPHHRDAAVAVLGVPADKAAVKAACQHWQADTLEAAIVARGGCAAAMKSISAWADHPQGRAVAAEPLIWHQATGRVEDEARAAHRMADRTRPLAGVRVLDLTRIIAGPAATRFLAGFGADVLRIDPVNWEEPSRAPEMTLGKQCARLDLRNPVDHDHMLRLLADADIIVHGYRADALERLGLGADVRHNVRPGLVDISLDAYGWTGPWANRRAFDSLVQMSTGIAHEGMIRLGLDRPKPLPVQALDHAAGYLMAAAAIHGLSRRFTTGFGTMARVSLARVAALLVSKPSVDAQHPLAAKTLQDFAPTMETTAWGPARRLRPAASVDGAPMRWERPASRLGSSAPEWPCR